MAKRRSPVSGSGGRGFGFEDEIAGSYLIDLLTASHPFNGAIGRLKEIRWQAQDLGWRFDDLVLVGEKDELEHQAGISIKSAEHLNSEGFDKAIVADAWDQRNGNDCRLLKDTDLLCLAVGEINSSVLKDWRDLTRDLADTSNYRMLLRLSEDEQGKNSQSNRTKRNILNGMVERSGLQLKPTQSAALELLRQIRVRAFDFGDESAGDHQVAIERCQRLLQSGCYEEAKRLWKELVRIGSILRPKGGDTKLTEESTNRLGLVERLKQFSFRDAIDYEKRLQTGRDRSRRKLRSFDSKISGETIDRETENDVLSCSLKENDITVLSGPSGSGKTSLTCSVCEKIGYDPLLIDESFFTAHLATTVTCQSDVTTIDELLSACSRPSLLILDSLEKWSCDSLNQLTDLMDALETQGLFAVHRAVMVCQPQGLHRIGQALVDVRTTISPAQIAPPTSIQIEVLLSKLSNFDDRKTDAKLIRVFQNLKVLQLTDNAMSAGIKLNLKEVSGETSLAEMIWKNWIEKNGTDFSASTMLQQIGIAESEKLSVGIPIHKLGPGDASLIPRMISDGLLEEAESRVHFSHDVVGDWARLRVLVAEPDSIASRSENFRWHSAVRMYSARLIERAADSSEFVAFFELHKDSATMRELLLDGLVSTLSSGCPSLESIFDCLLNSSVENLKLLIARFAIGSSTIDPTTKWGDTNFLSKTIGFWRKPSDSTWLHFLQAINRHDAALRQCPGEIAQLCSVVLERIEMGRNHDKGLERVASEIAIRLGSELIGSDFDSFVDFSGREKIFKALLLSVNQDAPTVEKLLRRVAGRSGIDETASETEPDLSGLTEAAKQLLSSPLNKYEPAPWPDGPQTQIDEAFRKVVVFSSSIAPLIRLSPQVAEEVLLACCIEDPPNKADMFGVEEGVGLYYDLRHAQPLFDTGSLLTFFEFAPDHAVSFLIRLVNFATDRWSALEDQREARYQRHSDAEDMFLRHGPREVQIPVDEKWQTWQGDYQVYRWSSVSSNNENLCTSALMAFEAWIYKLGSDKSKPYLQRVIREGRSTAFAGVLSSIGKKHIELFVDALQPLLGCWTLYSWDHQALMEDSSFSPRMIRWNWRADPIRRKCAAIWHDMEHRKQDLIAIGTFVLMKFVSSRDFFAFCIEHWEGDLQSNGKGHSLDIYINQLNWNNYTESPTDDGQIAIEYSPPLEFQERNKKLLEETQRSSSSMMFPHSMRQLLNRDEPLSEKEVDAVWSNVATVESLDDSEFRKHRLALRDDMVTGIAAALVCRASKLLEKNPERQKWCRDVFETRVNTPPPPSGYDSAGSVDDRSWPAFMVDLAVGYLKNHSDDEFALFTIGDSIASQRYSITGHALKLIRNNREELDSTLLGRAFHLAIRWSAVRNRIDRIGSWAERFRYKREKLPDGTEIVPNPYQDREVDDQPNDQRDKLVAAHHQELERRQKLIEEFMIGQNTSVEMKALIDNSVDRLESIEAETKSRMFWDQQSSHYRDHRRRADIALSHSVLKETVSWIDFRLCKNANEQEEWSAYLNSLLQIQQSSIAKDSKHTTGNLQSLGVFDAHFEIAYARSIQNVGSEQTARLLIDQLLDGLTCQKEPDDNLLKSFLDTFFNVAFDDQPEPQQFFHCWMSIIKCMATRPDGSFSQDCWASVLTPRVDSHSETWVESVATGLKESSEFFTKVLRKKHQEFDLVREIGVAGIRPAFKEIRMELLLILSSSELVASTSRRDQATANSVAQFLIECWDETKLQIMGATGHMGFLKLLAECRKLDFQSCNDLEKQVLTEMDALKKMD